MVEYAFWDVPTAQKIDMTTLYGPFLALCESPQTILLGQQNSNYQSLVAAFMTVDMYLRLDGLVRKATATPQAVSKKSQ
jgi:hypothetical protein